MLSLSLSPILFLPSLFRPGLRDLGLGSVRAEHLHNLTQNEEAWASLASSADHIMTQRRLQAEAVMHTRFLHKMHSDASAFVPAPAPVPVDSTQTDTVPLPAAANAFTTPTTSPVRERQSCTLYTSWVVQAYMHQCQDPSYNTTMHALNDMLVKWDCLETEDADTYLSLIHI